MPDRGKNIPASPFRTCKLTAAPKLLKKYYGLRFSKIPYYFCNREKSLF